MSTPFAAKKAAILSQLSTPSESYADLSPKGSVDAPIRDLVNEINTIPSLVTTSSCSGRIAVYIEGNSAGSADGPERADDDDDDVGEEQSSSKQGKGGGRWLFVTHTPLTLPASPAAARDDPPGLLPALLRHAANEIRPAPAPLLHAQPSSPLSLVAAPLVRLKFEPLILHVLAADLVSARALLIAAQAAGFRESGIASVPRPAEGCGGRAKKAWDGRRGVKKRAWRSGAEAEGGGDVQEFGKAHGRGVAGDDEGERETGEEARVSGMTLLDGRDHDEHAALHGPFGGAPADTSTHAEPNGSTPRDNPTSDDHRRDRSQTDTEEALPLPKQPKRAGDGTGPVMVAIRTMGLGLDAVIGYHIPSTDGAGAGGQMALLVDEAYVAAVLELANARFGANEERKRRLWEGVRENFGVRA